MKFALVNDVRSEAYPKLKGKCPVCGNETISKCGDIMVHHWAHSKSSECDRWWESESKWHRDWKNLFPEDWQEVTHDNINGEMHRADVTNIHGWVLEFQHSYLKDSEVKVRSEFYKKIIWVVDGLKARNGREQFLKFLEHGNYFTRTPGTVLAGKSIPSIVKKWIGSAKLVLIDIGHASTLFSIHRTNLGVFVIEIPRQYIINATLEKTVDGLEEFNNQIDKHINSLNSIENVPARGFLASIPHFIFNSDGTIT